MFPQGTSGARATLVDDTGHVLEIITHPDWERHLSVAVAELADNFGFTGQFNPVHSLQVAQPYRLVGATFGSAIDTNFWTATNGTGGASGVASSIATIASGTNAGSATAGWGKLISTQSARFLFAHPHKWRGAIRVTSVAVANSAGRYWGPVSFGPAGATVVTPQNGPYFSMNAAGVLSCCYASNGTSQSVASGQFKGDVTSYTVDTNIHAYEIVYYTMGIWYYIDGVLIHKVAPTTSILYLTLTTPIGVVSVNDGTGGTSGVIECWNSVIVRLGRDLTAPVSVYIAGATAGQTLKIGAGTVQRIVLSTINNNSAITLYDNTTAAAPILWAFDSGNVDRVAGLDFGLLPFNTGLTVVTTGAGTKVTLIYE